MKDIFLIAKSTKPLTVQMSSWQRSTIKQIVKNDNIDSHTSYI